MTAAATRDIIVVGATGQIGFELVRALAPIARVTAPSRAEMDLLDAPGMRAFLRDRRPDLIINAAAYTAVDAAETDSARCFSVNAEGPAVLAEMAARANAVLVHYSTDYVFDGRATRPYTEHDEPNPQNVYGRSKLEGERAIQGSGCAHLVFRTSWVYGQRGHNFLNTIRRIAGEGRSLRVVSDQVGAPTWCRCIAAATAEVILRLGADREGALREARERSGIYHMTAPDATSWHGFAQAIAGAIETAGERAPVTAIRSADYPQPARRPANSRLDCRRLEDAFGVRLPPWREQLMGCLGQDGSGHHVCSSEPDSSRNGVRSRTLP